MFSSLGLHGVISLYSAKSLIKNITIQLNGNFWSGCFWSHPIAFIRVHLQQPKCDKFIKYITR